MRQESPGQFRIIRKLLPYTTVAACLALIYMGWVFYSRWARDRELQREADQKSVEQSRKTYELYGSGQLKILLFYAAPATVPTGGASRLCYSVSNATSVSIDHDVEEIKPSLDRCVPVRPTHSTTYTLTAKDAKGHQATQSATVQVH